MYSSNATIEPRLIALLNEQPSTPRIDLPPLQNPNVLKASGRPHVLEPTAHTSNHNEDRNVAKSSSQKISQILSAEPSNIPRDSVASKENVDTDRALGLSSPQSLRKILQVEDESPSQHSTKKRHRIEEVVIDAHKDEFVQLPQPPSKKQKAPQQVVPPIIIGLFEPPPNAALFPPIASSAFHDSHGRNTLNVNVPTEKGKDKDGARAITGETRDEAIPKARLDNSTGIGHIDCQKSAESLVNEKELPRKKASKSNRKKWSQEETNQLLLGVHKYGIGKWKAILNDPSFKFNDRTAPDLKDRFRTCCPTEIREQVKSRDKPSTLNDVHNAPKNSKDETPPKKSKGTSSLMSENILIEDTPPNHSATTSNAQSRTASPDTTEGKRASRAHRRQLSDLESLGISGPLPFKKSSRKERRPFTEEEDNNIMKGYSTYGPQWAKIQADKSLGLQDRRSTDIRDRFRNRWRSIYESLAVGENAFAMKMGGNPKSSGTSDATTASTSGATSLPSLQSTESAGNNSEKPKMQRGTSFDLMALSSNSISNPYPPPTISSQTKPLPGPGKEIFYQLPNPSSSASSSNLYGFSSTNTNQEGNLFSSSSNEQQASFSYSQSSDWNDNILAPFHANGLGEGNDVGMETGENGIGVEEIVASFNPSSVGEMDIQRFLLDDTWPLK